MASSSPSSPVIVRKRLRRLVDVTSPSSPQPPRAPVSPAASSSASSESPREELTASIRAYAHLGREHWPDTLTDEERSLLKEERRNLKALQRITDKERATEHAQREQDDLGLVQAWKEEQAQLRLLREGCQLDFVLLGAKRVGLSAQPAEHPAVGHIICELPDCTTHDAQEKKDTGCEYSMSLSAYHVCLAVCKRLLTEQHVTLLVRPLPTEIVRSCSTQRATVTPLDEDELSKRIPTNLLQQLFPFQRDGLAFGVRCGGRLLLGDEMGLGKCWGGDTELLMYDGSMKTAESIVRDARLGEQQVLMGDDSKPRRIVPGSTIVGTGPMYRIRSKNRGRQQWTCNADHILVLRINARPAINKNRGGSVSIKSIEPEAGADDNPSGQRSTVVRQKIVAQYGTEAEAQKHIDELKWKPFTIECTVRDYLKMGKAVKALCLMYQPTLVEFQALTIEQRLSTQVDLIDRALVSKTELTLEIAWVLGMWLSDGHTRSPDITQIGDDIHNPDHSHQSVLDRLRRWLRAVYPKESEAFNAARIVPQGRLTTSGNVSYVVHCGVVLRRLLEFYGILYDKHLPLALLTQSAKVRRALLEGIIDGDGHYHEGEGLYEIPAKERRFIDGVVHLARGLGFSTGNVGKTRCVNEEGAIFEGWRIAITGVDLPKLRPTLEYKRCPHTNPNKDQRCDGFSVEEIGEGKYFGFMLDGNSRCLLADFVVTHNVSMTEEKTARARIACLQLSCCVSCFFCDLRHYRRLHWQHTTPQRTGRC
jgi:hypothetical protein